MKKKLILLVVVCIMVVSWYISYTNREPPPVAFSFLYQNLYYYSVWTIDHQGNIYRFHDDVILEMDDYEGRKQGENCQYVKTIDAALVEEKYDFFQDIISDRHYEKNMYEKREIQDCLERGTKDWYGYIYNWKGEEEYIQMHGDGNIQYWSEDIRMKQLADDLTELLREELREYDAYCKQLEGEKYFREIYGY